MRFRHAERCSKLTVSISQNNVDAVKLNVDSDHQQLDNGENKMTGEGKKLQIAILAAWSGPTGLTILSLDGLAESVASNVPNVAQKFARTVCRGLLRK